MPQLAAQQKADMAGSGHTLVQIVGDSNAVTINGAVPLVLSHYESKTFADAPADRKRIGEPGYTKTGRRETAILGPHNRQSIPLQGRADLLGKLRAWRDGPATLAIHVLTGAGGRGKTRLAAELAAASRALGWTAGFVRRDDLDVFTRQGCRTSWRGDTLVIVDYAAAKSDALAAWLRALLQEEHPDRLRLLLLERAGGERSAWWRELFDAPGPEGEAIKDLLATGAPLKVGPLADPAERYALFAATYRTARDEPPTPRHAALDTVLAQISLGGDPLFIAMFALLAARQGVDAVKSLTADKLALQLARQELDRIGKVWASHGLPIGKDRKLHEHLAAMAALCEGWDDATARACIEHETVVLGFSLADGVEPMRAALAAALPSPFDGIPAIQPDVIAEAAMIQAWSGLPDKGEGAIRRAAVTHRPAVTRSGIRACQDYLIRGQKIPLRWLQAIRADAATLEDLATLADALPNATVELREVAAELSQTIVSMARGQGLEELLAAGLNNLSNHLSDLGRREAALEAAEEAVAIRRTLSQARSDAFLPDLASALNNLSNRLSALGRREAALEAVEEGVATYRTLSQARPDAFLPDLASALNNLSNHLSDLGRREAALEAVEEAVATYRTLSQARPDAFLPDLASALNNLSNHLSDLGRREAALAAVEEAVAIHRTLSEARPDAFLPDLASALNNLSVHLSNLGRREAALEAVEEAVATYRTLSQARPDAFLPDLASALNNLSNHLSDLGRREAALAAVEEAVATYRTLSQARPDAFLPNLASALNNLSHRLSALGRREAALAAVEEAVATYRTLSEARPDAFLPDLAMALNNLSTCLSDLGRREAALAAVEEAVAIRRTLSQARPDAFLPDLASALNNLSNRLSDLGRREAALAAVEEAVATYRTLSEARPDAFLPDLAMALNNLSIRLSALGRREAALAAVEEAVATYRTLSEARPDAFLPDLASALNNLSNRLSDLGRREAALAAVEEAVATYRTLSQARPDAFLPDLAMALGARGAILRDADPAMAMESFGAAIAALSALFLALPAAFASLMGALCRDYIAACEQAGLDLDMALLAPIAEIFPTLDEPGGEHGPKTG